METVQNRDMIPTAEKKRLTSLEFDDNKNNNEQKTTATSYHHHIGLYQSCSHPISNNQQSN